MNELQEKILEIYKEFFRICSLLNLRFFAAGGTLLGAVRHNGFIPWDDDIDLYMPRKDYEVFIKEAPKIAGNRFFVQTHGTDNNWWFPFTKLRLNNTTAIEPAFVKAKFHQGVWIDIFPLDNFALFGKKESQRYERKRKELLRRISFTYKRKSRFLGKIYNVYIFIKYPSVEKAYLKLEQLAQKFNNVDIQYCGTIWDDKRDGRMIFKKSFFETFSLVKFETEKIRVVTNFDEFLTNQYGDWRMIPPPEKRKGGHTILYLSLTESFDTYLARIRE